MPRRGVRYYTYEKPRKIKVIKPSKYEAMEAMHENRAYWHNIFQSTNNTTSNIAESQRLANALPPDIYEKVCVALELPRCRPSTCKDDDVINKGKKIRRIVKTPLLSYRHNLHIERDLDSDTDVDISPREKSKEANIYFELLSRPEREQITWPTRYLEPERDDEKTLIKKADDLTDRIAEEFCQYMKQHGGKQQSDLFTPKAIKELFQIEVNTHAARGLCVVPKELHSINDKIANVTGNPELSEFYILDRLIKEDIKAETGSRHTHGFGSNLPLSKRCHPPRNNTRSLWRSSRHVPRDLVTLKTVWEGITNLKSVKEYCRWMIDHPEHRRAPYLNSLGMFDEAVLGARLTIETLVPPVNAKPSVGAIVSAGPIENNNRSHSQIRDTEEQ